MNKPMPTEQERILNTLSLISTLMHKLKACNNMECTFIARRGDNAFVIGSTDTLSRLPNKQHEVKHV